MFANFLIHKTTPWKDNTSRWDVRALQFLINNNGATHFDDRYPRLALILADAEVEEEDLEHMFRLSPQEDFSVLILSEVAPDYPANKLFDQVAKRVAIKELEQLLKDFQGTHVEGFIPAKIAEVKARIEAEQQAHKALVEKLGFCSW